MWEMGETWRVVIMRRLKEAQLPESQSATDEYSELIICYWSTREHITIIQKRSHCPLPTSNCTWIHCALSRLARERNKLHLSLLDKLGVLNLLNELKRECDLIVPLKSRGCNTHAHLRKGIYLTSVCWSSTVCPHVLTDWKNEDFTEVAFQWSR